MAVPPDRADSPSSGRRITRWVLRVLLLTVATAGIPSTLSKMVSERTALGRYEEADRIFTPYYTTKQHGTGLGLAIVQVIVADHNGRITVESEMGVGTAFHLELPVKPPPHPNQTTPVVLAQEDEKKEEA